MGEERRTFFQGLSGAGVVGGAFVSLFALWIGVAVMRDPDHLWGFTAAQFVYWFHIFLGAPTVGSLLFWSTPGGFRARAARGFLLIGIEAIALIFCGIVSVYEYPWYPLVGPHELVAAATTVPAVVLPCVAVYFLSRTSGRPGMVTVLAAMWYGIGSTAVYQANSKPLDACLPVSLQTHVALGNVVSGTFPDAERDAYIGCLGLQPVTPVMQGKPDVDWFDGKFWQSGVPDLQWAGHDSCRITVDFFRENSWMQATCR